jgi:alpha-galactosidase
VDDLGGNYGRADVELIRKAIDKCGRPIVLSVAAGVSKVDFSNTIQTRANLWRISADLWDTWPKLNQQLDLLDSWKNTSGPGHWADLDMIPLGHIAIRCKEGGADRKTRFTKDEQTTLMSLWTLAPSPLILGMNLPDNDAETLSLLTNDEVIAVNQDPLGKQAARIMQNGSTEAWKKELKDGSQAIGLFNRGAAQTNVTLKWDAAKLTGKMSARDLWQRKNLGVFENQLSLPIPAHGAVLLKLAKSS